MKIKEMEIEQVQIRNLFKEAPFSMFLYDDQFKVTDHNQAMEDLFRYSEINGLDLNSIPDSRPLDALKKALKEGSQTYVGPYDIYQR